jgi:predicted nucleic acid-binding protein
MNANVFLDTNILVYSYSNNEPDKRTIARTLILENNSFISTQVLQELSNTITKKIGFSFSDAIKVVEEMTKNNNLHTNTQITIIKACEIADRYRFSFYDSMIIAAALESNCEILYSEDMQHNQIIDDRLKIINPFL